jgi:hypothetical protein
MYKSMIAVSTSRSRGLRRTSGIFPALPSVAASGGKGGVPWIPEWASSNLTVSVSVVCKKQTQVTLINFRECGWTLSRRGERR